MITMLTSTTQQRYDTLVNWTDANPILAKGEVVVVVDGDKTYQKCGDGVKTFTELPLINGGGGTSDLSVNTTGDGNAVTTITLSESILNVNKGVKFATKAENDEKQDVMSEVTNEEILEILNS